MIVKIGRRTEKWAQIDKRILEDTRMSWKAKGLLCYLISRPENWTVMIADLVNRSTDKYAAVYAALKELRDFGYAELKTIRTDKGRIESKAWIIHESPLDLDLQDQAKQDLGNPHHTNTKDTRYTRINKNDCDGKCPVADGFFKDGDEYPPFICKCAAKLEEHLRQVRLLPKERRINSKLWKEQFRLLLQDLEGDKERLIQTLKTFINFPAEDFRPQIESAQSFRSKFSKVECWAAKIKHHEYFTDPNSNLNIVKRTVVP